ncbi:MAG: glucose-1-phosphate thymidylyltransferase [Bacteroidetes bacterium]|nr:MAG: glucose-1-phosphate thymidylyltransferase [Bacteroidota bacterium]
MNVIFFDDNQRIHLLPLCYTRPAADLRCGILTLREKWELFYGLSQSGSLTEDYLQTKFPLRAASENIWINGRLFPCEKIGKAIENLQAGQSLVKDGIVLAAKGSAEQAQDLRSSVGSFDAQTYEGDATLIRFPWDIFSMNHDALEADFDRITAGRTSQKLPSTNTVLGDRIFVEEGATAECSILNTRSGAIYLGKDSEVMEGSVVRGGLALCEHAALKLSTKIYGATTIGPHSKVGGEVNNSVIIGYSNKGHDGFLGNSVLGEWCNLGADTNNSNLKNNYAEVKVWSYARNGFARTGLQFCGLVMGDHSKSGINTMFNTGTVVGVSANIFGSGFPRNFVPSFSWGGAQGFETFSLNKADEVAEKMMARRGLAYDETEKAIMKHLFETSAEYRVWES